MYCFGMPTLIETPNITDAVALCHGLGLSFLELNTNFPHHQPHLMDVPLLKKLARDNNIFYTIHLNDETAVAEFHPAVSQGYRQAVSQTIDLAKALDVKILNMHLSDGAKYTMPDRIVYFYEAYQDAYLEQMKVFRDQCEEEIGDSGISICIENTNGFRNYQLAALELLLQSDVFALTMDIGHNCCAGYKDEKFIMNNKDRLLHMHIHDVAQGSRDHLALGDGSLELEKYLQLGRQQDCTIVLETKTKEGLTRSARWVAEHGWLG